MEPQTPGGPRSGAIGTKGKHRAKKLVPIRGVREDHDMREMQILQRHQRDCWELQEQIIARDARDTRADSCHVDQILQAISETTYLSSCAPSHVEQILRGMRLFEFQFQDVVCDVGHASHFFFIVKRGWFTVKTIDHDDWRSGNIFTVGDNFGDLSLIQAVPRSFRVVCEDPDGGELWGIDRKTYRDLIRRITQADLDQSCEFLKGVPLFRDLEPNQIAKLSAALEVQTYSRDEKIMCEGDEGGEHIYILKSGTVQVTIEGKHVRDLHKGQYFGERALLYDEPRSATITAALPLIVLTLTREVLEAVIGDLQHTLFRNIITQAMRQDDVFMAFNAQQIEKLVQTVSIRQFPPGANCVSDFYDAHDVRYLIVLEGEIEVTPQADYRVSTKNRSFLPLYAKVYSLAPGEKAGITIRLGRGASYGAHYVKDPQKAWTHKVVASAKHKETKIAFMSAQGFISCLGSQQYNTVLETNYKKEIMRSIYIFQYLSLPDFETLCSSFVLNEYKKDDLIIRAGEDGNHFYILKDGEVGFFINEKNVRRGGTNVYFGERSLILDEKRSANVQVLSDTATAWSIDKQSFNYVLSVAQPMVDHLKERFKLQDLKVKFDDLRITKACGAGAFGQVFLVCLKEDPKTRFALKRISKHHVVSTNAMFSVVNEMEIMKNLDHPFVIRQFKTWTDNYYLYMLQELITGGELYVAIRELWEAHAGTVELVQKMRFYIASIVLALEYVHQQKVVYRDLKPENVLLDAHGYIKLIDFGCAKKLTEFRTYTVAGTPHYTAPEVLEGAGYSYSCDIWTFGTVVYEMLTGQMPFGLADIEYEDDIDHLTQVYDKIKGKGKLDFPDHHPASEPGLNPFDGEGDGDKEYYMKDRDFEDLCRGLLCRVVDMRIGCSHRGISDIKAHPFFGDFNFDALLTRRLKAPIAKGSQEVYAADELDGPDAIEAVDPTIIPVDDTVISEYEEQFGPYDKSWDSEFTSIQNERHPVIEEDAVDRWVEDNTGQDNELLAFAKQQMNKAEESTSSIEGTLSSDGFFRRRSEQTPSESTEFFLTSSYDDTSDRIDNRLSGEGYIGSSSYLSVSAET